MTTAEELEREIAALMERLIALYGAELDRGLAAITLALDEADLDLTFD